MEARTQELHPSPTGVSGVPANRVSSGALQVMEQGAR